ncbi:MAG: MBOAT family protein [Deltaproteobacteria bacterium]|nr:MBOAT family protein [Deltaproteobacteria bacterium]
MLFSSPEYACLLVAVFAAFWLLAGRRLARNLALLAASYVFYASFNFRFVALVFLTSSLDFAIARAIASARSATRRRLLLATSITADLGVLAIFKYFNFFSREIADLLGHLGVPADPFLLSVALPVGISFYTFKSLSYTIDVYRGAMKPGESYLEYLVYVAFFPQMAAGPIARAGSLLPQLARSPALTAENGSRAFFLIGVGLVKKIAIADYLGAHMVGQVFTNPEMYTSLEALAGVYAYTFQIYADFSAYSDIAIGSALLLGIETPANFDAPYRAASLREFWKRWHISLSTWLRDYLYIPLGGSRKGPARTYAALATTMLLGGLWHGASLTFVAWGAMHGGALVLTRVWQRLRGKSRAAGPLWRAACVVLTFHFVAAAWVFFRAPSFEVALGVFSSIASLSGGAANVPWTVVAVLAVALATHWIPAGWMERARSLFARMPPPLQAAILVAVIVAVRELARSEVSQFIYFQF